VGANKGVHLIAPARFISVVVVNYNGLPYLERCLASLAAQTYATFQVIVVDNASTDGSADWLAARFPQVQLLRAPRNLGFAAGNNLGIRAARGEFIAALNNDTELEPDYLECLIAPMADPAVGACAPLMLEFDRRDRIDAAGIRIDRAGLAWNLGAGQPAASVQAEREVWGACAGAALYRLSMLDAIGLFDPDYFGFYEDVDLAWRAQRAGWKCMLAPQARAYHVHGGSFRHGSAQKLYLLARNRWWTLFKNEPLPALALNAPLIAVADAAALLTAVARHRSLAPLHGRVDAWRSLRRAWSKRRAYTLG
jgi:GT2 family glycosyltransferase